VVNELNMNTEHWWNGTEREKPQVLRERIVTVRTHVTLKDLTVVLLKIQVSLGLR